MSCVGNNQHSVQESIAEKRKKLKTEKMENEKNGKTENGKNGKTFFAWLCGH